MDSDLVLVLGLAGVFLAIAISLADRRRRSPPSVSRSSRSLAAVNAMHAGAVADAAAS